MGNVQGKRELINIIRERGLLTVFIMQGPVKSVREFLRKLSLMLHSLLYYLKIGFLRLKVGPFQGHSAGHGEK